jgi:hypothetical protein
MEDPVLAQESSIPAQMRRFSATYGKEVTVTGTRWRYYRLESGPVVVWLTGGPRRAALGFGFMELLASRYTVLAPDRGGAGSVTIVVGDVLRDGLVRPGCVVVRVILGQDGAQTCLAQDQHPVECLSPQGAQRRNLTTSGTRDTPCPLFLRKHGSWFTTAL